jgi:hypothetical protein
MEILKKPKTNNTNNRRSQKIKHRILRENLREETKAKKETENEGVNLKYFG